MFINKVRSVLQFLSSFLLYGVMSKGDRKWGFVVKKPLIITPEAISWNTGVYVREHSRIEGVKVYEGVKYAPEIIFEKGVTIQQNVHITCAQKIIIGKNTAIAANVTITDIDHCYTDPNTPIENQPLIVTPVSIGQDSKIYNNSVILPGSNIGKHCVIGANSVVSGTIPDYSIAVGSPARVVKQYDFDRKEWVLVEK